MSKYRKKPIIIDAIQWNGTNLKDVRKLCDDLGVNKTCVGLDEHGNLVIDTLEGIMRGSRGDYIIKGVKGEIYPCKPDIFIETYEDAE